VKIGGMLAALVTIISVMISFILIRSGYVRLKLLEVEPYKITLLLALLLAFALALIAGAALVLGLPAVLQIKSVLLIWAFIFIINLKMYDRKDCEQVNV
jgi:hypothetical protein